MYAHLQHISLHDLLIQFAFKQQRSRKHSSPARLRSTSFPLLRRARAKGHIRYLHSTGETHVCHIKHAPSRHHTYVRYLSEA